MVGSLTLSAIGLARTMPAVRRREQAKVRKCMMSVVLYGVKGFSMLYVRQRCWPLWVLISYG